LALEKKTAEVREQFIAVLGHDLRNPLASIAGGLRLLRKKVDPEGENWISLLQGSVNRMSGMIDNVMDFARTRLGGGMQLRLKDDPLEPLIEQIVAEFRNAHPDRLIETDVKVSGKVKMDSGRMGQLLSNLLGNALSYGAPGEPVSVIAKSADKGFAISVSNRGAPIPPEAMLHLFTAFQRGDVQPNQQGLGLGLYIAQEIAKAHGGIISVKSNPHETTFKAEFPQAG
jgi:signal transduction histidine kinase